MILAVCLNVALDVTYNVPALHIGESHRVGRVRSRAGGKGVNVARVLRQLREPVRLLGFAGGVAGAALEADLSAAGIPFRSIPTSGESRRTVAVLDDHHIATVLNEPGPGIAGDEWSRLRDAHTAELAGVDIVVFSGSVPPGVPSEAYRILADDARDAGVRVIIDAEGPALEAALRARPELVKPNAIEVAPMLGRDVASIVDAFEACRVLVAAGAGNAIVSRGSAGLVALVDGAGYAVRSATPVEGNPTGAGDALTASLSRAMARRASWPDALREASAVSAAAVAAPQAGDVAAELVHRLIDDVVVKEL